jgi:hypothetical protein
MCQYTKQLRQGKKIRFFFLISPFRVTAHRARGIGLLKSTGGIKGAGTIRVVFAATLFKKLISIHLVYLVYLVSKLLPVPVPPQRRLTVAGVCVPNLDAVVLAATGNLLAIWAEANTQDFPVKCSIVSTHHTFEKKQQ